MESAIQFTSRLIYSELATFQTFEIHEYDPNHSLTVWCTYIGIVHGMNDQSFWSGVTFLLRIWEVAGSNLSPKTGHPGGVSSVCLDRRQASTLSLLRITLQPLP
jgi:hypothetical protein